MADSIAMPVTNPITVHCVLTLLCMNPSWVMAIINVEDGFIQEKFENCEELHIEVPDAFKKWYAGDVVLTMNVPLYGAKQASYCFFQTFKRQVM